MKVTVVRNGKGDIVAIQQGPMQNPEAARVDGGAAGLVAGPDQTLEEREVPDDVASVDNPEEFARQITAHLS